MFDVMERVDPLLDDGFDPIQRIDTAVADLAGEDREQWTSHLLSEQLTDLVAVQERLAAEILRLVGEWDRHRAWEADGSLSAAAWLEHRTPLAPTGARRLVKSARLVDRHHPIRDALTDDAISTAQVDAIARVTSKERAPLLAEHVDMLVEQARGLPVRDFTMLMRRWAVLADDQVAADTHEHQWERRHLYASTTLDGWVAGSFLLDPVAGQALLQRLDHVEPPDPRDTPEGPRTLAQRRADALITLTGLGAGAASVTPPPNLNVVVDLAAITGGPPESVTARCDLDGIGPVTPTVLEHLACHATVTRVVTAGRSTILDMGRAVRVATTTQKRALTVRDRHCGFPSCHRFPNSRARSFRRKLPTCRRQPARHHITSWLHHGETNLDNLILLCRRHHTMIHNTRWTITRHPPTAPTTSPTPPADPDQISRPIGRSDRRAMRRSRRRRHGA